MKGNRRSDTRPEILVRQALHARGFRFRKDFLLRLQGRRALRVDIAFTRHRIAVFIDGCFWHRCPEHGSIPSSNRSYWGPKLTSNEERDREIDAFLASHGWRVLRIWEHEPAEDAAEQVASTVEAPA